MIKQSTTYSVDGRGHRILRILANGPHSFGDICAAALAERRKFRSKMFVVLTALRNDGAVIYNAGRYEIAHNGRGILQGLEEGSRVTVRGGALSLA